LKISIPVLNSLFGARMPVLHAHNSLAWHQKLPKNSRKLREARI